MIGQLALLVAGCALAAIAFGVTVARSNRRGVGVIARDFGDGRIVFLSTQVLDDAMFRPGASDDIAAATFAFGDYSVTRELMHRHAWALSPAAHVRLTGL